MNRRQVVIFGLATVIAGPAFSSDFQDDIIASLRAQGYEQITVEVTLLGRVKITAMKQNFLREIVVNPRTGEILRDLWLTADGSIAVNAPVFDNLAQDDKSNSGSGNSGSGNSGSGNSGSGDDGPDDDGLDDHGSDGSGSDDSGSDDDSSGGSNNESRDDSDDDSGDKNE